MRISDWSSDVCSSDLFDRYGPRRVVSGMLVFAVFGSALFGLAHSLGLLVVGRFLIGLGFAGGMVGSLVVLSRWLDPGGFTRAMRSEEHTSELQSLMRISYAVFCLKKKKNKKKNSN